MKKLLFLLLLSGTLKLNSQTTILGGSVYGTWTLANSPYLIQSAIMIPADSTLTIQPGVKIEFQGNYKLWALGRLIAAGTITDTIVFTCNSPGTGWTGVRYDNTTTSPDTSIFDYCKFEYGRASSSSDYLGGAIAFSNISNAIVSHSRFRNCYATIGGAIYGGYSTSITFCLFENNWANTNGALVTGKSGQISNNVFVGNYCTGDYAGAVRGEGSCVITNNIFYNNKSYGSSYAAGAIYCASSSSLTISNNKFYNNSSVNYGAGAIYCFGTPNISNNVFSNNSGPMGGAITCDGARPNVTNNTIMNNFSNYGGAIYCLNNGYPLLSNSILWGDSASISGNEIYLADQSNGPPVSYCDIKGGQSLIGLSNNIFYLGTYTNNINSNPLVVSPSTGSGSTFNGLTTDLSLTGNSPCINTGNPTGSYSSTDIAGNPRIFNSIIDIGAYELQSYAGIINYRFQNELPVYPNPTNGIFTIKSNTTDKLNLELFDVNGRQVFSKSFVGTSDIDANSLDNGIYTLTIKSSWGITNKKLIIAR